MITFSNFLTNSKASKEASLAIAKDFDEEKDMVDLLEAAEFRRAKDAKEFCKLIEKHKRVYVVASESLRKELYDCVVQYPTGSVEIFDKATMNSTVANPIYQDSSVVVLITKEHLSQVQRHGFDLLSHTGMAYQN